MSVVKFHVAPFVNLGIRKVLGSQVNMGYKVAKLVACKATGVEGFKIIILLSQKTIDRRLGLQKVVVMFGSKLQLLRGTNLMILWTRQNLMILWARKKYQDCGI